MEISCSYTHHIDIRDLFLAPRAANVSNKAFLCFLKVKVSPTVFFLSNVLLMFPPFKQLDYCMREKIQF